MYSLLHGLRFQQHSEEIQEAFLLTIQFFLSLLPCIVHFNIVLFA